MKLSLSCKTIILSFLSVIFTTELLSSKIVNAQTKLNSVPEIGWSTRLSSFELETEDFGKIFTFRCSPAPSNPITATVWGTDIYTVHSGICQSGVHAGMITKDGGFINVELTPGELDYQSSDRFGVKSKSYERQIDGMKFVGNPIAQDMREESNVEDAKNKHKPRRRPSGIERAVGNGVRRGIERTISDSIRDIFR